MSQPEAPSIVDTPAAWATVAAAISHCAALAVDIEGDGFHRYPERVALIQVALPDGAVYLVDPLALADLAPFGAALVDPAVPKILHSAAYDVRCLDRDFGFAVRGLFDTAIAAQLCGARRTGLMNVLADYLGVAVDKPKQLQRMDWSIRPLPPAALAYAVADVAHLHALRAALVERLNALGRLEWVDEECRRLEQVRYTAPDPPEVAYLAMRGARDLSDAGRAVLRELYVWRDAAALRAGRPPHHVLSNTTLLLLADNPDAPLERLRGFDRRVIERHRDRLAEAIRRGVQAPAVPWPRRGGPNPWTPDARDRLARLKAWRTAEAAALDLDAGVVWPAPHLEQVALFRNEPSAVLDRGDPPWVRAWQWAALGPALARFRRETLRDAAA